MEKKVMIAVDDSQHSKNAVRYAATVYHLAREMKFTLMHVQSTISQYLLDEARKDPKAYAALETVNRKNTQAARQLLDAYQEQMMALGIPEGHIEQKTGPKKNSVTKDILDAGRAGLYDAIVLGRRGLSGVAEVFLGSVSSGIVSHAADTPIWLVGQERPSQGIMVAVDGSENSLKAVDHLAFIIERNSDVTISFFHVTPRLKEYCEIDFEETYTDELEQIIRRGDKDCIDKFYAHAKKRLSESGIRENQIKVNVATGKFRVGKAVLDAYRQGNFGTLVVGRRGMNKSGFTGSVSRTIINQFSEGALWIVP